MQPSPASSKSVTTLQSALQSLGSQVASGRHRVCHAQRNQHPASLRRVIEGRHAQSPPLEYMFPLVWSRRHGKALAVFGFALECLQPRVRCNVFVIDTNGIMEWCGGCPPGNELGNEISHSVCLVAGEHCRWYLLLCPGRRKMTPWQQFTRRLAAWISYAPHQLGLSPASSRNDIHHSDRCGARAVQHDGPGATANSEDRCPCGTVELFAPGDSNGSGVRS
jgi:hypothetical protein